MPPYRDFAEPMSVVLRFLRATDDGVVVAVVVLVIAAVMFCGSSIRSWFADRTTTITTV